ncbi:trigger factor [soil metagenome]
MQTTSLQVFTERLEPNRVKLRVEAPEAALGPALAATYRQWAGQMKVPGFRKGKIPRQIIDARVGADVVREEALQDALPDLYREAMTSEGFEAIAPPDIQVVDSAPGAPLVFEATVDLRPDFDLPEIGTLSVAAPSPDVTEEEIDEQLERLRERFAELDTVGREARRGDYALIDLNGYRHGEPVAGASAPDLLYEIGSRSGPPSLDGELDGERPGAIIRFTDTMPPAAGELAGQEISFTVLLKEVKAKRLPAVDDELAKTVGEFDTLEELRRDLEERLGEVKARAVEDELRSLALDVLVDATDLEAPQPLVEREFKHRLQHFQEDLKRAGLTMADYERESGQTELAIRSELRAQVQRSIKAELILEEVARREQIDVSQEELGAQIAVAAARMERDPKELAEEIVQSGRVSTLAADIIRSKALERVVEEMNVVGRAAAGEEDAQDA